MRYTCSGPYLCTNDVPNPAHMCFDCASRSASEWADSRKERSRPATKPKDPSNKQRKRAPKSKAVAPKQTALL